MPKRIKPVINGSGRYELTLPDSWETYTEKDSLSFFNQDNRVGTLEISSYDLPEGKALNPLTELKDYLSKRIKENAR